MTHVHCVSCVSISSVSLAVKLLRKNGKASRVFSWCGWELEPYDCSSQNTEGFAVWCKLVSKECHFNDHVGGRRVAQFTTQFFILDKLASWPKHSLSEYGVKQHDLNDNWRITIKDRSRETKGQKKYRRRENGVREAGDCDHPVPPPPPPPHTIGWLWKLCPARKFLCQFAHQK